MYKGRRKGSENARIEQQQMVANIKEEIPDCASYVVNESLLPTASQEDIVKKEVKEEITVDDYCLSYDTAFTSGQSSSNCKTEPVEDQGIQSISNCKAEQADQDSITYIPAYKTARLDNFTEAKDCHSVADHELLENSDENPLESEITENSALETNFQKFIVNRNNLYYCTLCPKSVHIQYILESDAHKHIKRWHYGYIFICTICDQEHLDIHFLKQHYIQQHGQVEIIKYQLCKSCDKPPAAIVSNSNGKESINYEDYFTQDGIWYICKLCVSGEQTIEFTTFKGFRNHMNVRHLHYRYLCSECNSSYKLLSCLKKHFLEKHQDKEIPHTIRDSEEKTIGAAVAAAANEMTQLNYEKFISKVGKYYRCTLCPNRQTLHPTGLIKHIQLSHYGYRYKCTECENNFMNEKTLREHLLRLHNKEASGPLKFEVLK